MKILDTIYLDHQATTPVNKRVWREMARCLALEIGNPHSVDHCLGWAAAQAVEYATSAIAELIGADPDEIIFTSGATESNNLALLGLGRGTFGRNRRRILVSAIEHKCVLAASRSLEQQHGFVVEKIPVDKHGFVLLSTLEELLNDDVMMVSVMAVNNEIGTIQDIEKISGLCRKVGAIFHTDAAQAPVAIDTASITAYADLISLSSHKMYGPKGIGALYIRRDLQRHIEPIIYGGGQQNNIRSGTVPVPLCVGMGAAARLFIDPDIQQKRERLACLRNKFVSGVKELPYPIKANGPTHQRHPGNANIRFDGFLAQDILSSVQPHLAASTGSACTSGISEPSHVLKAIGLSGDEADSSIRFSLGFDTTDDDINAAIKILEATLARMHSS